MRGKIFFTVVLVALIAAAGAFAQQNRRGGGSGRDTAFGAEIGTVIAELPLEALSAAEIDGLTLMREEEKLARDVYITLAEEWNIRVFSNIARSEETHMAAVGQILERYDLNDPVTDDAVGSFTSPLMNELFTDLVESGMESYADALKVGAKIEELDIADLQSLMEVSDNQDILVVYQNLLKGSRNHLRAFDMQIGLSGATYTPEHLSADEYSRIASSPRETGTVITDPQAF